jgi:small subunit ribosomal protein S1
LTELEPEEDFATLFAAFAARERVEQGRTIDGRVVAIGSEVAFVDVGAKGEAVIDLSELTREDGTLEVAVGDRVQAVVVSTSGGIVLSRRLARGAASSKQLDEAFAAGLPVEGKVEKVLKGGYEVKVAGQRAFCPFSQIDLARTEDPNVHVGHVYAFRITEFKSGGKDLVVSRRALLEVDRRANEAVVRQSIVAGAVLSGRVMSVRDFGAFVDLGAGIQGLVHVSEMAWSRVSDPATIVQPGDTVAVKVLRVDDGNGRIALGMKQLIDDPWVTVPARYGVGEVKSGRVTRVADFGAFVELEPGVEGLAHVSTFAPTGKADGWKKTVPAGTTGEFEILSLDLEKKRIGVAMVEPGATRATRPAIAHGALVAGARVTGKVERHEPFGIFVFLGPGISGLIPRSETGVNNDADIAKSFPVGSDVELVVLEADPNGRRIRLSRQAVEKAKEADEMREYVERRDAEAAPSMGSLADKLRGALGRQG